MDYSGVIYQAVSVGGTILLMVTVVPLWNFIERKKSKQPHGKATKKVCKERLVMAFCGAFGLIYMCVLLVYASNPKPVEICGAFVEEHRTARGVVLPFTCEYVFKNENGKKVVFLDIFSKKKIYRDDFLEGCEYCIYFDARTDIIVKVEKMNDGH